jgi:DNA primase
VIPHEYIEELVSRNDIVDVVGSYVQLKRKGRLYGGLCPFHSEKTPSFYVYPDTQSFYCFGCGAGGDVISFTKKINSIDYPEAVKLLAGRVGMPEPTEDDKVGRMRSKVLAINKEAARFFHACLNSSVDEAATARAYWRRRGLDDRTIVRFGLGYAPNDGQALYNHLRDKGYTQQELDASGLFKRSQSGRVYCLFWKRVMTPIFDLRGNVIAFGGRVLDDSKPKYVNSPETLVYHKSETVFALQIAKKSASKRFVLCEGYMDVITMQKAGIDTAVCACGTALTADQVRLISEYADEVILSYDSDEAGQKATNRSLEMFRNSPVRVGVLQIPGAKDPDEYIKKYGADRFKALLDGVGNALDFKLGQLRVKYDLKQDAQRLDYIKEAVLLLADRSNPTEQDVYAGRLAEETNISKTAILAQLEDAVKKGNARRRRERQREILHSGEMDTIRVPYQAGGQNALGAASAEQRLIVAMLREPSYIPLVQAQLRPENIVMPDLREAYEAVFRCRDEGVPVSMALLAGRLSDKTMNELSRLAAQYSDVNATEEDVKLYLDRIANGAAKKSSAAQMSGEELNDYFRQLREKKQGTVQTEEE